MYGKLTITYNGETLKYYNTNKIKEGDTIHIKLEIANSSFEIYGATLTINDEEIVTLSGISEDPPYEMDLVVNEDLNIEATHFEEKFIVNIIQPVGGTVTLDGKSDVVEAGPDDFETLGMRVTNTPASGYVFSNYLFNGEKAYVNVLGYLSVERPSQKYNTFSGVFIPKEQTLKSYSSTFKPEYKVYNDTYNPTQYFYGIRTSNEPLFGQFISNSANILNCFCSVKFSGFYIEYDTYNKDNVLVENKTYALYLNNTFISNISFSKTVNTTSWSSTNSTIYNNALSIIQSAVNSGNNVVVRLDETL